MALALIGLAPIVFLVAGWAWRFQQRVLSVTGTGLARLAGRPGAVTDVQVTSVLVDEAMVLVGFRPAGTTRRRPRPTAFAQKHHGCLLMSLDGNVPTGLARLRRWEASGVALVMWRDRGGARVELSQMRTGHQVTLTVIAQPAPMATSAPATTTES